MKKAAITVRGGPALDAALKELGGKIAGRLGVNATKAGARVIAAQARANIQAKGLVISRDLLRSVRIFGDDDLRRSGGTKRAAYAGSRLFYGRFLEFGTSRMSAKPFLRPALDQSAQQAVDKMMENLATGIERETTKYRGK